MTGDREQRLSAALRAQAAGLGAASPAPVGAVPPPAGSEAISPPTAQPRPLLSAWMVLAVAVLLGALAGGLVGAISAW